MVARIDMRPELVGHYAYNRIHGGVISAGLDAMGGLAVMAAIGAKHMGEPPGAAPAPLCLLGTIDLRIDYLRPGIGSHFELRARCCAWARAWPPRAWNSWPRWTAHVGRGRRQHIVS